MEASAPHASHIEAEPLEWQPRIMWASARLLSGAVAFFMAAFLFAYFYLRLLNVNHAWRAGSVHPPLVLGIAVLVVLLASAGLLRSALRAPARLLAQGGAAAGLALLSIVLQVFAWTRLGFGPASGGYASVYVGWTSTYTVLTLPCLYWMTTQVTTAWRERRSGTTQTAELERAGLEACSFFWAFYVGAGALAFVVLYVV